MRISSFRESDVACRNCGRMFPGASLDRALWCPDCRAIVVRRSSIIARIVALTGAIALSLWIVYLIGSAPRFLVIYIVLVIAAYLFLHKLTQRVAFEIIRARGVPPPKVEDDE